MSTPPPYPGSPQPAPGDPLHEHSGHPRQDYPVLPYPPAGYPPPPGPQQGYPYAVNPYYPGAGHGEPPAGDPLVPADFSGWFQRVIGVVKRSFVKLLTLQLITALVGALVGAAFSGRLTAFTQYTESLKATPPGTPPDFAGFGAAMGSYAGVMLISTLIQTVVVAFVLGASIFVAVRDANGHPATAAEGLHFAPSRVVPFAAWTLLAWILVTIGTFVLILPGLYLAVVLFSSLPGIVVIERNGIGRCFELIKERFWATAGRLVVALLILGVYMGVAYGISSALGGGQTAVLTMVLQAVFAIPMNVVVVGIATVTYAELRFRKDGTATTPALAAEMVR